MVKHLKKKSDEKEIRNEKERPTNYLNYAKDFLMSGIIIGLSSFAGAAVGLMADTLNFSNTMMAAKRAATSDPEILHRAVELAFKETLRSIEIGAAVGAVIGGIYAFKKLKR